MTVIRLHLFQFLFSYLVFHQPKEGIENDILNKFGICGSDDMPCVDISFNPSSDTDTGLELYEALNIIRDYNVKVNKYFESKVVKDYEWGYNIDATFN